MNNILKKVLEQNIPSNKKSVEKETNELISNIKRLLKKNNCNMVKTVLNIQHLGFVTDQELSELYNSATLYICPSLYEGFGLSALEAMQHRVPVISSNSKLTEG